MPLPISKDRRELIIRVLNCVSALCGAGALGLLVVVIGWPLDAVARGMVRAATSGLLAAFVVQEALRLAVQADAWRFLRGRFLEVTLAVLAGVEVWFGEPILRWLGHHAPELGAAKITVLYLAGTQFLLVVLVGLRALRRNQLLAGRRLSP